MYDNPLLTIAIPTWNRSEMLSRLMEVLIPQIEQLTEVEVIICDNASTDETGAVVTRYVGRNVSYYRHTSNIGSDSNFVHAFQMARGTYFWLCSDDDLPIPGSIEKLLALLKQGVYDLIYLTSYGYHHDWVSERQTDPLRRHHHTLTDGVLFARIVNIMLTFISGLVVNKRRLLELKREHPEIPDPPTFIGSHLTQLSWTLPLLNHHRRSLVIWDRSIASRLGHNGGYSLAQTFGENLNATLTRCLPGRDDLKAAILNPALRKWFPSIIVSIRSTDESRFAFEETKPILNKLFARNATYWLFTYPTLVLPLSIAKVWVLLTNLVSKFVLICSYPSFWRKTT